MSNLINTGKIVLRDALDGGTVPLTLSFSLPPASLDAGGKALLVIYDLEQYKEHQVNLPNGEIGEVFFRGQQTVFSNPPEHSVEPGSGILFMAEVTFAPRPRTATRRTIDSFAQKLERLAVISNPAFKLEVRCLSSVDAQGNTLSPQVIDVRPIGVTGAAKADFDRFTKSGDAKRSLTIRLLSLDRTRVLVSQLNPQHCFANQAVTIRYVASQPPLRVGQSAPAPSSASAPGARRRFGDITGEYVELSSSTASPKNGNGVLSPAVLRVHHVGNAVCGWYSPLPSFVLAARVPSTTTAAGAPLFSDRTPKLGPQGVTPQRGVFVLIQPIPGTSKFRGAFVFRSGVNRQDELDPEFVIAQPDLSVTNSQLPPPVQKSERVPVVIEFEPVDRPFEQPPDRIRISFPALVPAFGPASPDVVFARISNRTRLPWQVVRAIAPPPGMAGLMPRVTAELIENFVEPLPPAVKAALIGSVVGPQLDALIAAISAAKGNPQQISQRSGQIDAVNTALRNLATSLRSVSSSNPNPNTPLSSTVINDVREAARLRRVTFDGKTTDMLTALQLISDDIVERELALDPTNQPGRLPTNLNDLEALRQKLAPSPTFDGFAAFNIWPQRNLVYRFEFTDAQGTGPGKLLKPTIVLDATFGAFLVKISKLDAATLKELDPVRFPATEFGGFFVGGSIGLGVGLSFNLSNGPSPGGRQVEQKPGATIGPMTVDVLSFSNLQVSDFEGATFSIFASGVSASAGAVVGEAGANVIDAVFSLTTNSVPPVTLEAEIKKGFQKEAKVISTSDAAKKVVELDEALNGGNAIPLVEASASLTLISLVKGRLTQTQFTPSPRAQQPTQSIKQDTPVDFNSVSRDAKFRRGSAEVTPYMRNHLDLRLAVLRKLVEYPGWLDIEGLASPEWDNKSRAAAAQTNLDLSQKRAIAVRDAIFESCGAPGEGIIPGDKDINVQGKGSRPFDAEFSPNPGPGQHLDVFAPVPANQAIAVAADREKFLPTLRRVDIAMNGVFVVRIQADQKTSP